MDKVSIVIPVYNNEAYLEKCLESVINQTYNNIEIVLINDGSSDNSLKIMKNYSKKDKRIIIIDKENEGVSTARNIGIKKCSGEYITFVDSDDYLESDAIEKLYHEINTKNVDVVRSNYQVHYQKNNNIDVGSLSHIGNKIYDNNSIRREIIPKILSGEIPCFVYLLMIKKKLLINTKLFPTDIHMMEDVVFYLNLLTKASNIYLFDYVTYNIQYNELGATNNKKNYERNILNVLEVNKYIKEILKEEKLDSINNITLLNTSNCEAISDFIFKQYLSGNDCINFCKELSTNETMTTMIENIDKKRINIQRRIIIELLKRKKFKNLKLYFFIRKILHNLKG